MCYTWSEIQKGFEMRDIEVKYLDQYKKVDNLCAERYEGGVSGYIAAMDATPEAKREGIVHWNDDYRALKRLRWLRNRITHDTGESDCSNRDLASLTAFYGHLKKGSDSLSVLAKREAAERRAAEQKEAERRARAEAKRRKKERSVRDEDSADAMLIKVILAIAAAAVAVTFIVAWIVKSLGK